MLRFLDALRKEQSVRIVKVKNRFASPSLSGYRDFNIHVRIDVNSEFTHICELQIHHIDIKELDKKNDSHSSYEYFRSYFAGSTGTLQECLDDLQEICGVDNLDDFFLNNEIDENTDEGRLTRLGRLFRDQLAEHQWALRVYIALLSKQLNNHGPFHPAVGKTFTDMGLVLRQSGNLDRALGLFERSLDVYLSCYDEKHETVANAYNNIANCYLEKGVLLNEAMDHYQKYLEIMERDSQDVWSIARVYVNLALIHCRQHNLKDAMEMYHKSLSIRQVAAGEEHVIVAETYTNMAFVLEQIGSYEDAMEMYLESVAIRKKLHGPNHPSVAGIYHYMAMNYELQGKLDKAVDCFKMCRDIQRKHLSDQAERMVEEFGFMDWQGEDDHSDDSHTNHSADRRPLDERLKEPRANYLALGPGAEHGGGRTMRAATTIEASTTSTRRTATTIATSAGTRIGAISKSSTTKDPSTAKTAPNQSNESGRWLLSDGGVDRMEESDLLLEELNRRQNLFGTEMETDIADSYFNIARGMKADGRIDDALALFELSLSIRKVSLEDDSISLRKIAAISFEIAEILAAQYRHNEALLMYKSALEIRKDIHGESHELVGDIYAGMARVRHSQKHGEAAELYNKALEILKASRAGDHRSLGDLYYSFGNFKAEDFDLEGAIEMYQQSLDVRLKEGEKPGSDVADTYIAMGSAEELQGKGDDAIKSFHKALSLQMEINGDDDESLAGTLLKIALLYSKAGEIDNAREYYQRLTKLHANIGDFNTGIDVYGQLVDMLLQNDRCEDVVDCCSRITSYIPSKKKLKASDDDSQDLDMTISLKLHNLIQRCVAWLLSRRKMDYALDLCHVLVDFLSEESDVLKLMKTYGTMAEIFISNHQFNDALKIGDAVVKCFLKEEIAFRNANDTDITLQTMDSSNLIDFEGKPDDALSFYDKAMKVSEAVSVCTPENYSRRATILHQMSTIMLRVGKVSEAIATLERLVELYKEHLADDLHSLAVVYHSLATTLLDQGHTEGSLRYSKMSLDIQSQILHDPSGSKRSDKDEMNNQFRAAIGDGEDGRLAHTLAYDGQGMAYDDKKKQRAKEGYCLECRGLPVLLYTIKKSRMNPLFTTKQPRAVDGLCKDGICFACFPNKDPSKRKNENKLFRGNASPVPVEDRRSIPAITSQALNAVEQRTPKPSPRSTPLSPATVARRTSDPPIDSQREINENGEVEHSSGEENSTVSSTYGDIRDNVVNRSLLDPYGDKGVYTGVILRSTGIPHGLGHMEYEDGRIYEGNWRHGRWHGYGKATGTAMMENTNLINVMERVSISGLTEECLMGNTTRICAMDMGFSHGQMPRCTMVNLSMGNARDMEDTSFQVAGNTLARGMAAAMMVLDVARGKADDIQMAGVMKESGGMGWPMAMVVKHIQMEGFDTTANGWRKA